MYLRNAEFGLLLHAETSADRNIHYSVLIVQATTAHCNLQILNHTTIITSNLQRRSIITLKIEPQAPRSPIYRLNSILLSQKLVCFYSEGGGERPTV